MYVFFVIAHIPYVLMYTLVIVKGYVTINACILTLYKNICI